MWAWLQGLSGGAAAFVGAATGSAIGLIALVIGALFNAHLNRKRDDRLRSDDARSVASALFAELGSIREALLHNVKNLEDTTSGYAGPDIAHMVHIFPEVVSKLGVLDGTTIRNVVEAYAVIEQHMQMCMMLGAVHHDKIPGRRMVVIPAASVSKISDVNRHTAKDLDKAIGRLAKYVKTVDNAG
jgi:hypothetical protein